MLRFFPLLLAAVLLLIAAVSCRVLAPPREPIAVGLIAPLSGSLAASGEAIHRGMLLSAEEVNRDGGVLGRPLTIVARDVRNDPVEGERALRAMVAQHRPVAVFGGIYSPVMLGQIEAIHELQIPLINPWGSVAAITQNGRQPNFAFRVSVSDESADEFLVRYALGPIGARRPGILADTSAWGDSNVAGLTDWLGQLGTTAAGTERFAQGDTNMAQQLDRLRAAGADTLLMVANAPEGAAIVRGMAVLGWRVPVVSHWGIAGGPFVERAGVDNAEGVYTLQTFSFTDARSDVSARVLRAYHARFGTRQAEEIPAAVGVAHGYDGVHLLARAVQQARSVDGPRVRDALEQLAEPYEGLVKRYAPAFTPDRHDALHAEDYLMAVWHAGRLVPAPVSRLR